MHKPKLQAHGMRADMNTLRGILTQKSSEHKKVYTVANRRLTLREIQVKPVSLKLKFNLEKHHQNTTELSKPSQHPDYSFVICV
jgi:hypothetical protein